MKIRLLLIAVTTTVTRGSATYFFSFSVIESANCLGVRPAACTSSSKGREILPSGRTAKEAVRSASLQTAMWSASSGPMTYSGPAWLVEAAVAVVLSDAVLSEAELAAGWAGAACANAILPIRISAATAAFHADFISLLL